MTRFRRLDDRPDPPVDLNALSWRSVPASATASGTAGHVAYDGSYFYVCTATNTWVRAPLSTWVPPDPYFSNVVLLLHGDGSLADSSSYGRAMTAFGNASAAGAAKWGSGSLTFDGDGDYLTTPSSTDFDLTGDFVIEAWVRLAANPGVFGGAYGAAIVSRYQGAGTDSDKGWQLRVNGTASGYDTINLYTGQTDLNWSASLSLNTWHYIAVARSGSSIRAYLDGSQVGSTVTNSDPFTPSSSRSLSVGRLALETTFLFDLNGRIDDLRITKGSDRGFTGASVSVPTAAFPDA